jgi:hypothetical protein
MVYRTPIPCSYNFEVIRETITFLSVALLYEEAVWHPDLSKIW